VKHKRYDHGVLSCALPHEDLITSFKAPERSFDIPPDSVDVVFSQQNLLQWHKNVQQRIFPFTNDGGEATRESLLHKMREEQNETSRASGKKKAQSPAKNVVPKAKNRFGYAASTPPSQWPIQRR